MATEEQAMIRKFCKFKKIGLALAAMLLAASSYAQDPGGPEDPNPGTCDTSVAVEGTVHDILEAGSRVFAVTSGSGEHPEGGGLYISCSGGDAWYKHPEAGAGGTVIASDPADPNTIYVTAGGGNIGVSRDGGESWVMRRPVEIGNIGVSALAALPGGELFAGMGTGEILHSGDYGLNWESRSLYIANEPIRQILVDPDDANHVVAAIGTAGISHSLDGGRNFEYSALSSTGSAPVYWDVAELALVPSNSSQVYSGGSAGLLLSVDGGNTFGAIGGTENPGYVVEISFGRRDTSTMFVVSEYTGVLRSSDGGQTFTLLAPDLPGSSDWYKSALQLESGRLLVGSVSKGIVKSDDDGATWQSAGAAPEPPPSATPPPPPQVNANLTVTVKNLDGNKTLEAGTNARFRIEVRNDGPELSTETFVHVLWSPPGTGAAINTAFTLSSNKGSCIITQYSDSGCTIGTLGVGETAKIDFRAATSTSYIGTHQLTAHVSNAQGAATVQGGTVATKKTIACFGDCGGNSGGGAADPFLLVLLALLALKIRAPYRPVSHY
jgi:photosystem II stability/assembly factor-like uncharacterized protein